MKLSILIPTTPDRELFLIKLINNLSEQCGELINVYYECGLKYLQYKNECEIVIFKDNLLYKIGEKRTRLYSLCNGEYACSVDSDDDVSSDYIEKILNAIESKPDCCSLTGLITWDGELPEIFEHSKKYSEWKTNTNNEPIKYERYPNHLNVIKKEIAIQFPFISVNYGEDHDWSTRIHNSGTLKTEATIEGVIYYYKFRTKK